MAYYHVSHEDGHDKNILSRVRNALIKAISCEILLPKVIMVIMDNDLMDAIEHYKPGISYVLGRTLEWVINEFHKIITSHKENLPTKCRKFKYPTFLWMKIPNHEIYGHYNTYKDKYNSTLEKVCKLFREMETLDMDKGAWKKRELSYFEEGRISHIGLTTYWQAICNAFEIWDRNQMKAALNNKHMDKHHHPQQHPKHNGTTYNDNNSNCFHRECNHGKNTFDLKENTYHFKIPHPPPVRRFWFSSLNTTKIFLGYSWTAMFIFGNQMALLCWVRAELIWTQLEQCKPVIAAV